jgi:hypothetical protein
MTQLVKDGALTIHLFHGTSSLFADSILQNGLGAKNPIQELRVMPFLQRLCETCESTIPTDPKWLEMKWLVEQMIGQDNTLFRHGLAFLSPSRITAVRYAASNPFGSEAISTCLTLYQLLAESERECVVHSEPSALPVVRLLREPTSPVLVEASDVRVSELQGERGQSVQEVVDTLEKLVSSLDMKFFQLVSQQSNFSLIRPVEASRLQLYNIKVTSPDPAFPEYELAPRRCQGGL